MNRIFKIFAASLAGVMLLASCVNEATPLASSVNVDKTEINPEGASAAASTVKVTSDGDWFAVASSEWITVEPSTGVSGTTDVKITVADNVDSYNELNGPRTGQVTFCYGTSGIAVVTVNQKGEPGLNASRSYSLVKKTEDITEGNYLIVFEYKDEKGIVSQALKPFKADNDSYYSWLYSDEVVPKDDVITMENASNAFKFVAVEGGFKIAMSNDRYLFQAANYNNFYSTTDIDKADVWTVTLDEKGLATITNTTVAGKVMQFSSTHKSAGAYNSLQEGGVYPYLYIDAKPATGEVLEVEGASVNAKATSVSIPVSSNRTWKVRNHDEWITDFTKEGTGNGTIEVKFGENESKTDSRTATFTVIGENTNLEITLVQSPIATTVHALKQQITGSSSARSSYYADFSDNTDAVITYVNGRNIFIEDKTAAILFYGSMEGAEPGKKVSGILSGEGYIYSGVPQMSSISAGYTLTDGGTIPQTEITIEELLDKYDENLCRRVLIKDVTMSKGFSNRNGEVSQNGKTLVLRAQLSSGLDISEGSEGDLLCFPTLYNTTKQLGFWDNDHFTYTKMIGKISVASELNVVEGKTASIKAETNSKAAITYKSDNTAVATVAADGTVTGVAEGTAKITLSVAAEGICTAATAEVKVNVVAPEVNLPYEESFAEGLGLFKMTGDNVWKYESGNYGSYAKASGYISGAATASEGWLVSPVVDLTSEKSAFLSFDHTGKFFGTMTDEATVWAKKASSESWTKLEIPTYMSGKNYTFVNSGNIDLKDFVGSKMQFAFKYVSTTSAAGTWEVNNIKVVKEGASSEDPGEDPGETSSYASNVVFGTVSSAYTDGVATVNGTADVATLKLGTSSKYGEGTITLPAGTKKLSCYAVAWKGAPSKLEFSVGGTVIGTQEVAANDGATGSSPYTITVADSDHYSVNLASPLAAETVVTVKTIETGKRVILFGVVAE